MKKIMFDLAVTLVGGAAIALGVCFAWPKPAAHPEPAPVVKGVPGDSKVSAQQIDLVDKDGNVHVSLYVKGGEALMDIRQGAKIKTLNLPAVAKKLTGGLFGEGVEK